MEKEEASLPTLKAAAGNPEGSFTPAAAEAGLEVGVDAPVMTDAVGPLVTAAVGKTRPPVCTSNGKSSIVEERLHSFFFAF